LLEENRSSLRFYFGFTFYVLRLSISKTIVIQHH
jgi:hypothetical protein